MVPAALLLASGCQPKSAGFSEATPAIAESQPAPLALAEAEEEENAFPEADLAGDISQAAATPVPAEKTVPANVKSTGPVAEVIQLASSGVEEGVLLTFVTNSFSTFNLRAEDIIYLNDIGVPSSVITAMIQRDEALKQVSESAVAAAASPAVPNVSAEPPAAPMPEPEPYAAAPAATEPPPPAEYPAESYPAPQPIEYTSSFYEDLAPYGTWVDVAGYGYCWQPTIVVVNPGWQPYFHGGRWVYTDCGWYWMSDYSWGWAPFHYGRWFRHNHLGWCWRPDTVWGPSWVCWRYTDAHCGWAPLPPGVRFSHARGLYGHEQHLDHLSQDHFHFIAWNRFRDHHLERHDLPRTEVSRMYSRTTLTTSIVASQRRVVNNAIPPERVAAATRTQVPRVALRDLKAVSDNGLRAERLSASGKTLNVFRQAKPATTGASSQVALRPARPVLQAGSPAPAAATPVRTEGRPQPPSALPTGNGPAQASLNRTPAPSPVTSFAQPAPGAAPERQPSGTASAAVSAPAPRPQPPAAALQAPAARPRQPGFAAGQLADQTPPALASSARMRAEDRTAADTGSPARPAQRAPLILRGPSRSLEARTSPSAGNRPNHAAPATADRWPQPQAPAQAQPPAPPAWAAPRSSEPAARVERPQAVSRAEAPRPAPDFENRFSAPRPAPAAPGFAAPSYQAPAPRPAPAEVPRYAPPVEQPRREAPAPSAPQHSYSAPERPSHAESRPAAPAFSAPAPSPSPSHSSPSSSDRPSRPR